jgi:glycosyltransferase involved in cell wall biosynthesis
MSGEEPILDIVIPTYNRPTALAVTLTSLISQTYRSFNLLISDQSNSPASFQSPEFNAVLNVLYSHGHCITLFRHLPKRGMAEHRQFLLDQVRSEFVLYMDDDLILEPYVVDLLLSVTASPGSEVAFFTTPKNYGLSEDFHSGRICLSSTPGKMFWLKFA